MYFLKGEDKVREWGYAFLQNVNVNKVRKV
jgi:hypothetical protein